MTLHRTRDNSHSYVALRSHNTSIEVGMIMQSFRSRVTENAALDNLLDTHSNVLSELTIVHKRLMVLERIAINPAAYPTARVQRRHSRGIPAGKERWNWISKQPDIQRHAITPDDVWGLLVEADRVCEIYGLPDITEGLKWLPR